MTVQVYPTDLHIVGKTPVFPWVRLLGSVDSYRLTFLPFLTPRITVVVRRLNWLGFRWGPSLNNNVSFIE